MKRNSGVLACSFVFALLLAGCEQKETQTVKFINPESVIRDSGLAEQLKVRLKAVDERLQQGLKLAQENGAKLPEEKRHSALLADQQLLNLEWQRFQNQANGVALKAITEAAENYRQAHKLLAVLPTQSALASAPEADISKDLAKQLEGKKLEFGELPKISVKSEEQKAAEAGAK